MPLRTSVLYVPCGHLLGKSLSHGSRLWCSMLISHCYPGSGVVLDCLFDLILYVHSTIFQLCGTGLPGLNQY